MYLSHICDLGKSVQQEELRISIMLGVLDTFLDEFKNEKVCLESLLDDWDVEIGNLQERQKENTNEVKLLESCLIDKEKMAKSLFYSKIGYQIEINVTHVMISKLSLSAYCLYEMLKIEKSHSYITGLGYINEQVTYSLPFPLIVRASDA